MTGSTPCLDHQRLAQVRDGLAKALISELQPAGYWDGCLSGSALSTAVAVVALHALQDVTLAHRIAAGREWLAHNANADGGWGDTRESPSNVSTTLLTWCALSGCPGTAVGRHHQASAGAASYLEAHLGNTRPEGLAEAVLSHYGRDRTFSVPILTLCALSGQLGDEPDCWASIPQLPFELAACPQSVFKWLRLPVVSYALPALIAVGLVRHQCCPGGLPGMAALRRALTPRMLRLLSRLQPASGGFLEAIPLTAFVALSLVGAGFPGHSVVSEAVGFLTDAQRPDGSWPIDTNLRTWVSTLAVKALLAGPGADQLATSQRQRIRTWLLAQQFRERHPYTGAAPGGWAWTDLPGGVPDADDTAGALLALYALGPRQPGVSRAATAGLRWLFALQNRDGGLPTFCRGWGKLPFDRSCPDISAHAVRAVCAWLPQLPGLARPLQRTLRRLLQYLCRTQREDGAWLPLWFGNQQCADHANPVYGTAQVLLGLQALPEAQQKRLAPIVDRALDWLVQAQGPAGGWGGGPDVSPSVEETALGANALLGTRHHRAALRGVNWLLDRCADGPLPAAPIGLYFSSLWYSEALYPCVFALSCLQRASKLTQSQPCQCPVPRTTCGTQHG